MYYSEEVRLNPEVDFSYYDYFDGNFSFEKGKLKIEFTWPNNNVVLYDFDLYYGGMEYPDTNCNYLFLKHIESGETTTYYRQ